MIYVTQGHEKGIGLEVFFRAFGQLTSNHDQFVLVANLESIKQTARSLNLTFKYLKNSILINSKELKVHFFETGSRPQSTIALENALNIINNSDILFTLPTSKDQLVLGQNNQVCHGYTEYLRKRYNSNELAMSFLSPKHTVSLVTDHIPLAKVSNIITSELIFEKVQNALRTISKIRKIHKVIIAAINPHVGEGGLLGNEDDCINNACKNIKNSYPHLEIIGPVAGDTLHFYYKDEHDLLVYMYHDQGLAPFKFINGLIGINLTCGLPFIRVSVDHGTSFDLFGKNAANESGCLYLMEQFI